jgi:arsenate reductase
MITFWHNPRCSKSRQALALLQEAGAELTIRKYLQDAPSKTEIIDVQKALGAIAAIDMMRPGEKAFKELGLARTDPEERLIAAMAAHPILIERPIAIKGSRAVIGRPPEGVKDLL